MESKYDYEVIRDYLHGLVDKDTAHRIRELIRTDDVARNIAAGILQLEHEFNGDDHEIESYIEGLRQRQLKLIGDQNKTRMISRTWVKLAAAILIIAVVAPVLWLTVFQNDRGDLLTQELNEPYPLSTLDRSALDTEAGFEFYVKGDYKNAIAAFDKPTEDATVVFYNGLSYLYAGEYGQAVMLLSSELLLESRYREQAEWFKALALIKAGRNDEARRNLEIIKGSSGYYKSAEAGVLLEGLR